MELDGSFPDVTAQLLDSTIERAHLKPKLQQLRLFQDTIRSPNGPES
jgi:hypothetical protein